jgi:hypothetical protein
MLVPIVDGEVPRYTPQYILALFGVENKILQESFLNIVDSLNPSHTVFTEKPSDISITINTGLSGAMKCVGDYIDVYDVLKGFNIQHPSLQHAVKKILMTGKRGFKTEVEDLVEIISALSRSI